MWGAVQQNAPDTSPNNDMYSILILWMKTVNSVQLSKSRPITTAKLAKIQFDPETQLELQYIQVLYATTFQVQAIFINI